MEDIFLELSLIVIITVILAIIAKSLRQPLIIAYILAGIFLSPYGLDLVKSHDAIATFSQLGITFLLFMVGLHLNPKIIRDVGKISLITGLGQIIFTSTIGFLIAKAFNFTNIEALYLAIAFTFSSTIVIMKLLSDKKEMNALYGRISIGFLIVQDVVAMLILIFVSSISTTSDNASFLFLTLVKAGFLFLLTMTIARYILPIVIKKLIVHKELLILSSVAWCLAMASLCHFLGFSIEIGALLAGISLSISPFRHEISNRIKPLRDFFLLLFFVYLGTQMEFANFEASIGAILIFSLFILIGNPLIVMILMGTLNYTKRTSFLAGLTVAQISEFSLILIALGVKMGHLDPIILSMAAVVGLITITGSTYFIIYGKKLYKFLSPHLSVFEKSGIKIDQKHHTKNKNYDVLLIGYDHMGQSLVQNFKEMKKKFLIIDYNPDIIKDLKENKIDCRFGDIEDPEIFDDLNMSHVKMLISSIENFEINLELIRKMKELNPKCILIVTADEQQHSLKLYKEGATYVIMPDDLGSLQAGMLIERNGLNFNNFSKEKTRHLTKLQAT